MLPSDSPVRQEYSIHDELNVCFGALLSGCAACSWAGIGSLCKLKASESGCVAAGRLNYSTPASRNTVSSLMHRPERSQQVSRLYQRNWPARRAQALGLYPTRPWDPLLPPPPKKVGARPGWAQIALSVLSPYFETPSAQSGNRPHVPKCSKHRALTTAGRRYLPSPDRGAANRVQLRSFLRAGLGRDAGSRAAKGRSGDRAHPPVLRILRLG